jgi:GNAT superfamily N-acetyltransferase
LAGYLDFSVKHAVIFESSCHAKASCLNMSSEDIASDMHKIVNQTAKVEMATLEDLPALTELVVDLFSMSSGDFIPDRALQERGLRLILEQPSRGRIVVIRNEDKIFGMVNMLFTISTARGGFVILMEDVVIHPHHRGQGYGTMLVNYVIEFAKRKKFLRITLLTDKISAESQEFFQKQGFSYSNMIPMRYLIETDQ